MQSLAGSHTLSLLTIYALAPGTSLVPFHLSLRRHGSHLLSLKLSFVSERRWHNSAWTCAFKLIIYLCDWRDFRPPDIYTGSVIRSVPPVVDTNYSALEGC